MDMQAQLRELFQFLSDANPQVRHLALSNLVGQTSRDSPYRHIFFDGLNPHQSRETDSIRDLKQLCRDQPNIAHDAFRALVNLSESPLLVSLVTESSFLIFLVSYILNPDAILADLASMLLSNLTSSTSACSALLSLKVPLIPWTSSALQVPFYTPQSRSGTCPAPVPYPSSEPQEALALPLLVDSFVHGAPIQQSGDDCKRIRNSELHFLSSVFANISISPAGRLFFVTPRPSGPFHADGALVYPLAKIVAFTEHQDIVRRRGVISTLKNCAFHTPAHRAILTNETDLVTVPPSDVAAHGIDALSYILLPLAGPEELDLEDQEKLPPTLQFLPPTKKRESSAVLRLTLVQSLLLLCTTRWGRDYMRTHGVYEVIRTAHLEECMDEVSAHMERLVHLIKGEEGPETKDDDTSLVDSEQRDEESDGEDYQIEVI